MKIIIDNTYLKLDEKTTMFLNFEVGDVFISKDNAIIAIVEFGKNETVFINADKEAVKLKKEFLDKEFKEKYRFSGIVSDDFLREFDDAIELL